MSPFGGGHQSRKFVLPLIFFFLFANTVTLAQNFWQQTSGPVGGDVRAVLVKSSGEVFVGHDESGIYRSTDNGANWTAVNTGLTNGTVNALANNAAGDLFAGTFGGIFLSTDNGATWTAANTNLTNTRVRALAIKTTGEIFAGTEGGGVFRSTDNAKTWVAVNSGLTNAFIQALAINNNTGDIFAGTTTGFFLSSNNGGVWRAFNPGLSPPVPSIRSLAINSLGNVFAGTNNGVYWLLSTTATWTPINTGLTNFFIPAVYAHANGNIFAGTEGSGVFRSVDNGNNWVSASVGLGVMTVQAFAGNSSGTVFAGTTGGVFRSTTAGPTFSWTEVNTGMLTAKVSALALKSTSYIFAGTLAGRVFRSKDFGASWALASTGLPNDAVQSIHALAVSSTTGDIFAGTGNDGMYRSSNDGTTWTRINLGLAESNILSLVINASGHIFAGGASDGVARSTDNGESWQDLNTGLTNTTIRALALNTSGDLFAGTANGIFYSKDNGNNWTAVNTGLPIRTPTVALAVDTNNDVYAALANGTVYRLPDSSTNWALANSGLPTTVSNALAANAAGHVFSGTALNGAYRTLDSGAKWSAINSGLTTNVVLSLAIGVDGFAFAGTGAAGVFRSTKSTAPPEVSFSSDSLKYGNVLINTNADLTVTLRNTGFSDLSIVSATLAGPNANQFSIVSGGAGTLAPNATQDIVLRFSPQSTGEKVAYFILLSEADSSPDTVTVIGTGAEPLVSFSPTSLNYGSVLVNANSDLTVRLTNAGTANLSISSTSLAGINANQFSMVSGSGAGTLRPNDFRDITLRFLPSSAGNQAVFFILASSAASTPDTVTLTGAGVEPLVSFSNTNLQYGNVLVNADADLTVRLTNTGTADLSISNVSLVGPNANQFSIVNIGGAGTLAPNAFLDITLRFSPTSAGNKIGYFVLASNAVSTPDTVALAGTGIAPLVSFSSADLQYGNVLVNAIADLTVRLTNTGTADLSISSTGLAGANANQFSIVAGGGAGTLRPNAFRDITLRFSPTSTGNKNTYFVLTNNAASTPDSVTLTGTGITPLVSFSTDSLKYGNVLVNAIADLTVRLTNTGTANLSINSTSFAGANANQFSIVSGGVAGTLAPNAFRDIALRFSPTSTGNKLAYFILNSNAASTPDTVTLTGTGITPLVSFSTDSLKYGNVVVNAIADLTVRLTNTGTANLSINSTSFAGTNANQFNIISGGAAGTLAPNAFRDITLRFSPTSTGNKLAYFVLNSNAASMPDTVTLTGSGITSFVTFSTDSLKYGNVVVNANADLTVRLTNTGTADLSINATSLAGANANQFNIVSGGETGTLAPNAFRDITLRFAPTSTGNKFAYFVLNSNAASMPDTVTLTGSGITSFVTFSTDSLKYGNVVVNAIADLTVRLTNTGTANLSINSTSLAGANANQFGVVAGGATGTLAPNAFRDITLRFSPTSTGNKIAYFVLNSNAASTPDTVTLTGIGISSFVSFSTDSLKYGNVAVNANSDLTVRVTNTGKADLSINATALAGASATEFTIVNGGAAGTLAPNAFRDITLRFAPTSTGNKLAYFVLTSNAASTPDTVTLTGTGVTPLVSFSTDSLKYGNVVVNANSDLTVRLTNTGTANLSINSTSFAGANANQFSIVSGGAAGIMAPNAFRDITMRFAPTSTGNKLAYFVLNSNAASTPDTVTLTGVGITPLVSFSNDSLKYGNVVVNANSDLTVRLTNTGTASLSINSASLAGANASQFSIVIGGEAGTLAPNAFRNITLRFSPTSAGNKLTYFVLTSNAASMPDTVTLTGTGITSLVSFSTDSLKYGNVVVNANSDLTVRLTNTGTANLSISSTSLAGANVNQFNIVNGGEAGTLAPNAFRDITLRFAPTSVGNKIAYFVLTSNAASTPDTVTLTGTGITPLVSFSTDSLKYGNVAVNANSDLTVRLTNTGTANLSINSTSLAGANANQFNIVNGGDAGTLAPNAFRDITLRFAPTSVGNKIAYFVLTSNAASTPDTVTLTGNGITPLVSFSTDSLKYGNVAVNANSDLTVRLTNTGTANLSINATSLAGANANQFSIVTGGEAGTLASNAFRDITLRFSPTSTGNKLAYFVLASNAASTPDTVTLTGNGITPLVSFSTDSLKYGNVGVNANSDLTVRLTNTGTANLSINATSLAGANANQFSIVTGGDTGTLAPNAFRDITLRFAPTSVGNKLAYFVLNSNAASTPDTVALTGAGVGISVPLVSFSNDSLEYGKVLVNTNSDLTVRLTNTGTADLSINTTSLTGANTNQFSIIAGGAAGTLAPNAFRDIALRFAPASVGNKISYFVLTSNAASTPDTVTLTGTGSSAILSLSSDSLQFGSWVINSSSEQAVRLTNTGTTDLAIGSTTLAGLSTADFSIVNGGGAGTLLPNEFRDVRLRFTPQSLGNKIAQLVVASDAASSPDTVTLLGNGVESVAEQDSLALVALFNSTNGPNWKNKTNWLQGPVSSWFGVTVRNNAVTTVQLDSNNLAGTLPAEIGNFTQLTILQLSGNQLDGVIPNAIGNLRNLADLNLSGNQLAGEAPNAMTNLNALRELYLHNNRLVNLPVVTAIAALDTLFIHGNRLTFEDIEPNLATVIDSILYAPQDSVGSPSDTTLLAGAKLTLRVNVGGGNNQYQWLKNGAPIAGANSNAHTILVATSNDVGSYVCRITNTVATQLTLFSRPQRLSAVNTPRFAVAPKALNFGAVRVNASFDQTVTLTNALNVDIAIQQTTIIATDALQFTIVNGGGAQVLPANSSRTMTVRFIPKTRGSKFAALQIISNASATLDTVNLIGAGVEPLTTLSNTNISFGAIAIGAKASQTITLTNSGTANLAISFVDIVGTNVASFSILSGGAAGTLAPNASRDIALRFTPQTAGAKNAALVIISDAASSPDTVLLSGSGNAPALALSRRNVDFGNVWVGGNPVAQTVTLTNTGAASLNITAANLIGANANAFQITSGGGSATIAPAATRDIVVQFSPPTVGAKNAALLIASNAASIPDTVRLSGAGSELVVNVGNSGNPLVGTRVNLAVSALGGFAPTSRFLFYRLAGETQYDSIDVAQNGSSFTADIPPSAVTVRGVEFYVRFSDGSTVVTYPAINARNNPQMIRVRVNAHAFPLALEPNTYKMIAVGMDLDSTGFAHVLEEYAKYDTLFWRLFRWENNRYEEYSDINARFTPGTAFWLITRSGAGFGFNNALSSPSVQPFTITLQPGWNQIANPFAFPVAVNSLRFTGRTDTLAFWDGVEYQYNVTVLEPWEGYFIFNLESAPITLTIPPVAAVKKSGNAKLAANEYMLQLAAQMIGTKLVDTQNFVGLLNRAQIDRDALDFAEAPAIGDYVQLSIVENHERFAGNFKPANGDGQQWAFEVCAHVFANVAKKLQISLQETGQLPEGFQRFVLDQDYGAMVPLSNETFRVELNEKLAVRRFKIIVGTKAYAESNNDGIPLVPVDYVLEQNYPNPFALNSQLGAGNLQTTIRYQLNKRAPVVLEIRNMLGQKVRTLVDGEQSTGQHAATWDGLDEAGGVAASGVYFYTLKTAEFTATRKLVLTR